MKKHLAIFLVVSCLGTFSWAQGTKTELFDTKKSQDELNVMKAALAETLAIAMQNIESRGTAAAQAQPSSTGQALTPLAALAASRALGSVFASTWGGTINAFYLYGQGAVFMVPAPLFPSNTRYRTGVGEGSGSGIGGGVPGGVIRGVVGGTQAGAFTAPPQPPAPPKPAAPPAPPAPPSPPTSTSTNPDEVRKMLEAQQKAYEEQLQKYQESMQKSQEAMQKSQEAMQKAQEAMQKSYAEALAKYTAMTTAQLQQQLEKQSKDLEARRAQTVAALGEIKTNLIEALANYGDALTTVKPNEYISIVILLDAPEGRTVISAQRSWITDYKAGKLSLDAFKQKVLQYSE
jgi:hypothetical protein